MRGSFLLGEISIGRLVLPSPKIDLNLYRIYDVAFMQRCFFQESKLEKEATKLKEKLEKVTLDLEKVIVFFISFQGRIDKDDNIPKSKVLK